MKQASLPLYIRFGEIPDDKISRVHRGDSIVREEGGLSVYHAISDGMNGYYPLLPEDANDDAVTDYFRFLLESRSNVYLVTGTEMFLQGADREPLLMDPVIIKDITHLFRSNKNYEKIINKAYNRYMKENKDIAPDNPNMIAVREVLKEIMKFIDDEND